MRQHLKVEANIFKKGGLALFKILVGEERIFDSCFLG